MKKFVVFIGIFFSPLANAEIVHVGPDGVSVLGGFVRVQPGHVHAAGVNVYDPNIGRRYVQRSYVPAGTEVWTYGSCKFAGDHGGGVGVRENTQTQINLSTDPARFVDQSGFAYEFRLPADGSLENLPVLNSRHENISVSIKNTENLQKEIWIRSDEKPLDGESERFVLFRYGSDGSKSTVRHVYALDGTKHFQVYEVCGNSEFQLSIDEKTQTPRWVEEGAQAAVEEIAPPAPPAPAHSVIVEEEVSPKLAPPAEELEEIPLPATSKEVETLPAPKKGEPHSILKKN